MEVSCQFHALVTLTHEKQPSAADWMGTFSSPRVGLGAVDRKKSLPSAPAGNGIYITRRPARSPVLLY